MNIVEATYKTNLFKSKSEIRRLIEQRGLKLDWETITDINYDLYAPDWDENMIYMNCIGKNMNLPCCENIKLHTIQSLIDDNETKEDLGTVYKTLKNLVKNGYINHIKAKNHPENLMKVYNEYIFQNYFVLTKGKKDFWILEMY